jgi:folylpolyglutamate synthase/dihydropteroate synthase
MKMNITYTIDNLDRQTSDNLVVTAHWRVSAVDGEHTAGAYGSVGFTRGDSFTPFEALTEAQVIAWVKEQLDVAEIEANLAGQIAVLKAPKTASGLPW